MAVALRPPETIATSRLLLRRPVAEDAESLFAAYTGDIDAVRYLTWRVHTQLSETAGYVADCEREWDAGTSFPFAITEAGRPAHPFGMIRMRQQRHAVSFGYVIARSHGNRGFTTEALAALLDWSLHQPGIFRAFAHCDVDNAASARVMEKAGMTFEGIFRRFTLHPNVSDQPRDALVYAKVV